MYLYKLQPSSQNPLAISMVTIQPTVQRLWNDKKTRKEPEKKWLAGVVQVWDGTEAGEPGWSAVL